MFSIHKHLVVLANVKRMDECLSQTRKSATSAAISGFRGLRKKFPEFSLSAYQNFPEFTVINPTKLLQNKI